MPTDSADMKGKDASDPSPTRSKERNEEAPSYDTSRENYAGISSGGLESLEDVRAARDFAEMIVDTVREGLLVLDLDLHVQAANESFYDIFEAKPEETVGRPIYELGGGQWDIPELRELLEGILPEQKEFNDYEVEHYFEDIGRRVMLLNARRLDDHQMILLALEDVTERQKNIEALRESEHGLRELNQTLEQRVADRTADLERRNEELQSFAHIASHDLREPLRKIQAFSGMLRDETGIKLGEADSFYLERIQSAAVRMEGLLSDLLAFSRVATHTQPFRVVHLDRMVEEVLRDYELTIRETEANVEVQADVTLEADSSQLRQLMTNLIGNAFKYRREDVAPRVRISAARIHDGEVLADGPACRITVEDNGIGFEEKYLDRIFEPFQRLHGREAYEGAGMGLALCRRIVDRHRGIITAESTPGEGSRFIVLLPACQTK